LKSEFIYKILSEAAWASSQRTGVTEASDLDRADGYVHLSTGAQVTETLRRHFPGVTGLVLVAYGANSLGDALKWEASRGGELFPHFYGQLSVTQALWSAPLPIDEAGVHILPDVLA
jgi:uncharacterized protein (DUF952 family)